MRITQKVKKILANYESDNPGTKANLARILMEGKLGGTGRMVILPVDQGFEHGPARSFAANPVAYDPHYLFQLALDAGCNAYAAPLGALEAGADTYAGAVPLILKMNSANSLYPKGEEPTQAITASVDDALRIGASAIGYTLYPGSIYFYDMLEELRELIREAKSVGLPAVVWSYPRGGDISKDGETAMDVDAYAAHMACLAGAHIVKVKLPSDHLEQDEAKKVYKSENVPIGSMSERVAHIVKACFDGRRLVVFSGGGKKGDEGIFEDARAIRDGGGNGSIIGRNSFQRNKEDAVKLLGSIMDIYKDKA
jgi:class I fructose-bisphosphate aldolase